MLHLHEKAKELAVKAIPEGKQMIYGLVSSAFQSQEKKKIATSQSIKLTN